MASLILETDTVYCTITLATSKSFIAKVGEYINIYLDVDNSGIRPANLAATVPLITGLTPEGEFGAARHVLLPPASIVLRLKSSCKSRQKHIYISGLYFTSSIEEYS